MIFDLKSMVNVLDSVEESLEMVNGYRCPCCDASFDVEEVRKYFDKGEVPICMDCGETLEAEVEGD